MEDGVITLWSVAKILQPAEDKIGRGCVGVDESDKGMPVKSLEFNPHKKNLLASGGQEVFIRDITNLKKPTKFKPGEPNLHEGSPITSISWNRVVPHILASASQDGKIVVWDLKQSKSIFQFIEPSSQTNAFDANSSFDYFNDSTANTVSSLQQKTKETKMMWNPTIPTQFAVMNDDEANPIFNVWDLRSPQYPVTTF